MDQDIRDRFEANIHRVRNLVLLYEDLAGKVKGRPTVQEADLLRGAVILLHASLEDLLRSLAEWKLLLNADEGYLNATPFAPGAKAEKEREKLSLLELSQNYPGKTVAEVIEKSILNRLETQSFNNLRDVQQILRSIGLSRSDELVDRYRKGVKQMMDRRHLIAHRADRNHKKGRGQHGARSLGKATVQDWVAAVEALGRQILEKVGATPEG